MKLGIIQNNPHLSAYNSNIKSITRHIDNTENVDIYLTSHVALAGNPWNSLACDGSFFNSISTALTQLASAMPPASKLLTQIPSSPFATPASSDASEHRGDTTWFLVENAKATPLYNEQINMGNLSIFAPHLPPCATANEALATLEYIRFLDVPANTQALYLSCAFPFCDGLDMLDLLCECAQEHALPIFYVNTCGASDGIVYAGSSAIISEEGDVLACLSAFEEDYLYFDFSPDTETGETISCVSKEPTPLMHPEEALFHASNLAIADYAKKTGIRGAIVGMSGGMDSALVACLACEALGHENVIGIMMPSPYSSEHSIADSKKLMENLGMKYYTVPINSAMDALGKSLPEELFGQNQKPSVMENIQARSRGVLLMAFANQTSFMVLGTGNKSENAMGYCTLYGDTVGAIEPIGDIYKTRVYMMAQWFNEQKGKEIIPQHIFDKAPSAELKPDQKDQDTLPPYELLDAILEQILENGVGADQLSSFEKDDVQFVLEKLYQAEFKRKQCPPVVQVSFCPLGVEWNMPSSVRLFKN